MRKLSISRSNINGNRTNRDKVSSSELTSNHRPNSLYNNHKTHSSVFRPPLLIPSRNFSSKSGQLSVEHHKNRNDRGINEWKPRRGHSGFDDIFNGMERSFFPFGELSSFFDSQRPQFFNLTEDPISNWKLAMDVTEEKNEYIIHADVPGMNKKDIKIEIKDNYLVIKGERKVEKIEEEENPNDNNQNNTSDSKNNEEGKQLQQEHQRWKRVERRYGSFYRKLELPKDADYSKIKASVTDGQLKIQIPKGQEPKPFEIEVN